MAGTVKYKQYEYLKGFYQDGWEHIRDRLRLLDARIRLQVLRFKAADGIEQSGRLLGLAISDRQVSDILDGSPAAGLGFDRNCTFADELAAQEEAASAKELSSSGMGIGMPLYSLGELFGLSPFEKLCVIAALAAEIDKKYEILFAYLNDDITKKYPTVDLLMKLAGLDPGSTAGVYGSFGAQSPFGKYIMNMRDGAERDTGFISLSLRLDTRVLTYLLGYDEIDPRISSYAEIVNPDRRAEPLLLGQDIQLLLRSFAEKNETKAVWDKGNVIFHLYGPKGSGKKLQARNFARYFERDLIIVDTGKMLSDDKPVRTKMELLAREACLRQAVVCFDNFDVVLDGVENPGRLKSEFIDSVKSTASVLFLTGTAKWRDLGQAMGPGESCSFIEIGFEVPSDAERLHLWKSMGKSLDIEQFADLVPLAGKFRFTPGQISSALLNAGNTAAFNNREISADDLYDACYSQASHHLEEKGVKITPRYGFDDIILPAEQKQQLMSICNQVRYRCLVYGDWGFDRKLSYGKGLSAIFSGPPGTGKTMSAEVIAMELKLELYRIDLSQTVSKYIGETEKNLHRIFTDAQSSNAILFFDEADALFGKRSEVKDSKDRYANIETAYLLQKIEEYEGVTILATNFNGNIDDAFIRRMQYIIEFPFPNPEYREMIWRSMFPREAPLSDDIDYGFLAERLEISGGNIKNIAVAAAFYAAAKSDRIGMEHIIKAAKYELKKIGRILLKEDLGEYY